VTMRWEGEFLVYATINDSLTRTLDEESDAPLVFTEYQPRMNHAIFDLLKTEGPIYDRAPQHHPLCDACREEGENGA
jgi:hypothetical protein